MSAQVSVTGWSEFFQSERRYAVTRGDGGLLHRDVRQHAEGGDAYRLHNGSAFGVRGRNVDRSWGHGGAVVIVGACHRSGLAIVGAGGGAAAVGSLVRPHVAMDHVITRSPTLVNKLVR
eukprot:COSAG02_NODE_1719_length_11197_cov_12.067039_2_plen_119_part_00